MIIADLAAFIEEKFPLAHQENYDNCGLIIGDTKKKVSKVLIALDCTDEVIKEAQHKNADLIITHHPLIFTPIKKITSANANGDMIIKLIKSDIALYAVHTNLDNSIDGINLTLAKKIGLKNLNILLPRPKTLKKIVTFVPKTHTSKLIEALSEVRAGNIGLYSHCAFTSEGRGCFKPASTANPFVGKKGEINHVEEIRLEMIFNAANQLAVEKKLKNAHPYEQPAFDIIDLDNTNPDIGAGIYGYMEESLTNQQFLKLLTDKLPLRFIRHNNYAQNKITKVAVCSGAGFFVFEQAKILGVNALITSEVKHHEFLAAQDKLLLCDIDHHEGEIAAVEILANFLRNIKKVDILITEHRSSPVNIFH